MTRGSLKASLAMALAAGVSVTAGTYVGQTLAPAVAEWAAAVREVLGHRMLAALEVGSAVAVGVGVGEYLFGGHLLAAWRKLTRREEGCDGG